MPTFSTRAVWASLRARRGRMESTTQRIMPPTKMALVVPMGKYIPMATSMGLRTLNMIMAMPIRMPVILDSHAEGATKDEVLASYPSLRADHINAALAYAAELAHEERLVPIRAM